MRIIVLISTNGHMVVTSSITHSMLHLPSGSTSACDGSLPGWATQTFIPERSRPLVVLPEMDCCSFPLTLVTGHGSAKRRPKGSPVFQAYLPYHHCGVAVQFPLSNQDQPHLPESLPSLPFGSF